MLRHHEAVGWLDRCDDLPWNLYRIVSNCPGLCPSSYRSNTESCNVLYTVLESQFEPSTFLFSIHHSNLCIHDSNINVQYSFTSCSEISAFSNMPYVYSKTRNSRISRKSRNELFSCKKAHILYDIHFILIPCSRGIQ